MRKKTSLEKRMKNTMKVRKRKNREEYDEDGNEEEHEEGEGEEGEEEEEEGCDEEEGGQPTRPTSTSFVIMTMLKQFSCHTIRQKS